MLVVLPTIIESIIFIVTNKLERLLISRSKMIQILRGEVCKSFLLFHFLNLFCFFVFLVPSCEETSFLTTFYGLYFRHHLHTYYTLQIMLDRLCGQLFMYCTLDTSSHEIWVLLMIFVFKFE